MSRVFYRKKFSDYLGEQRAIDDIVQFYQPDGGITPTPTPVPVTPTPTPTKTSTPTPTPSITPSVTSTLTPTPTKTGTPTPTPTRTPAPGPAFDPDAAAYLSAVITAGGTVTSPMSAATNNMFLALKSNGLYNSLDAFYPMMGATSGSTALNGIRTNSSFDITWNNVGDLTFTISGVTNNGSGYGNTGYVPRTHASPTNYSNGNYVVGGNIGGGNGEVFTMGVFDAPYLTNPFQNSGGGAFGVYGYTNLSKYQSPITFSSFNGSYISTFDSTPTKSVYKNYSDIGDRQVVSGATGGVALLANLETFVMVLNLNGSPYTGQYYTGRMQFAFMGDSFTPAQVETIDSIINAFQTALGRNTY